MELGSRQVETKNLTKAIGYLVFVGAVTVYVYLYVTFLVDILDAPGPGKTAA